MCDLPAPCVSAANMGFVRSLKVEQIDTLNDQGENGKYIVEYALAWMSDYKSDFTLKQQKYSQSYVYVCTYGFV